METAFFAKTLNIIATVLPFSVVFGVTFGIVKDDKSRRQIGAIIKAKGLWPPFLKTIKDLYCFIEKFLGPKFSFRSLDTCLAIAFFFVVISLASGEIMGSSLFIGNVKLLVYEVKFPGAGIVIGGFSILLATMVLYDFNRKKIVLWLIKYFPRKPNALFYSNIIYWFVLLSGWSILGLIVWTLSSKELFSACVVIGGLAIFGSINKTTRLASLVIIFILPFIILIIQPNSGTGLILSFLNVIVTPVKGCWDWISIGIMIAILKHFVLNEPSKNDLIKFILINLFWGFAVIVGLPFTLAFAFRIFNIIMSPLGVESIDWNLFYALGFSEPLSKGLFYSTICITSIVPPAINIVIGCIAVLTKPLPGKRYIYNVCIKEETTDLDRWLLAAYISSWIIILLIGGVFVAAFLWLLVNNFGKQTFFAVVDVVRQLL